MSILAANLNYAITCSQVLDIHIEPVDGGTMVVITGNRGEVSVVHADASEALRRALYDVSAI